MKALMLAAYEQLELTDIPAPTPASDEVLIRVAACGICGSDVHGFDGSSGRRIPPIVMGHEAAGTIAQIGTAVTNFSPGDRVTFDSTLFCGQCDFCLSGQMNLCETRQVLGVSCTDYRRHGAFAEFVTVPERILHRLPPNLPFAEAAMLEAVAVALHAVRVSEFQPGQSALVIGAGMIGLLTAQSLRAAGCPSVLIADIDPTRLAMARAVGIKQTLQLSGEPLIAEILNRTERRGLDHAFEAVGNATTVAAAIRCVRKGGTVTLIGNIQPEVTLPLQYVVTRQIRLQGSCSSAGEYPEAIAKLASGAINVKPLISAIAPLEDAPSWFHRLHQREPGLVKVIITPAEARHA